jgi:hypothetical protein
MDAEHAFVVSLDPARTLFRYHTSAVQRAREMRLLSARLTS